MSSISVDQSYIRDLEAAGFKITSKPCGIWQVRNVSGSIHVEHASLAVIKHRLIDPVTYVVRKKPLKMLSNQFLK